MNHLFTATGRDALHELLSEGALLGFDFDGTLAPIVADSGAARMTRPVSRKFGAICRASVVAIITGRNVADLRSRLEFQPKYLIGNHGAEGLTGTGSDNAQRCMAICEGWMAQLNQWLKLRAPIAGLYMEHKAFSICIHYRHVSDCVDVVSMISNLFRDLNPAPKIIAGTLSVNLIPNGAPLKSDALEALVKQENVRAAFYIGDEETDEMVFRSAPPNWVTVKVGHARDSAAKFYLDAQDQIGKCLDLLLEVTALNER